MKKIFTIIAALFVLAACSYNDDDIWRAVDDLDERVKALEERVKAMNTEIESVRSLVEASAGGYLIISVDKTDQGYLITFSNNTTIEIKHGQKGDDGTSPLIGVAEVEGVYYWTITVAGVTTFVEDADGNRIPVTGKDGAPGEPGQPGEPGTGGEPGKTPVIGVDQNGFWTVDYGDGPQLILDADGNAVKAAGTSGDSVFSDVVVGENEVTFHFASGGGFSIPLGGGVTCFADVEMIERFLFGENRVFELTLEGVNSIAIAKPDGWKVSIDDMQLIVKAPVAENTFAETEGNISLIATGEHATVIFSFEVAAAAWNYLVTFENIDEGYLADSPYGSNLYNGQYGGFWDEGSNLYFYTTTDGYYFSEGGIAISQWNDMQVANYTNQCSVYYMDPETGFGGHNGSETFAVSYGYYVSYFDTSTYIMFIDEEEYLFDHFWVTNATWPALYMSVEDPMTYDDQDWFKLVVTGYDAAENATGVVEFYLADFRTPTSPGIVTEWTKVDLTTLGKVNKLHFDMQSTQSNAYGMSTPAYFCMDDLAILME